jgi:hypothetical protein
MTRILAVTATIASIAATPVTAQMTPVDPAQRSTPNVMVEGMRNGSNGRRTARAPSGGASARATCRRTSAFAAKLGERDPRIVRLRSMCAQSGYPTR